MSSIRRAVLATAALLSLGALSGCIGLYNNTTRFAEEPTPGMSEVDVVAIYGTPDAVVPTSSGQVLTYKVRDNKYIVLVGLYNGYDLVVLCENGEVVDCSRVTLAPSFSVLQPWPWRVLD